jgi:uncharacterized membrane protein YecN with MAPEG domain
MPYDVTFNIEISAIYIALSGLFLVLLALDVIRGRWKYHEAFGEGDQDPVSRRMRVRANAAEYFPVALLLLVAVENIVTIDWLVHSLGCLLLVSRLLHAAGLRGMAGESLPRILGTAGSIMMIGVSASMVLIYSF